DDTPSSRCGSGGWGPCLPIVDLLCIVHVTVGCSGGFGCCRIG
uniref:Pelovaterin n=1 Tax=Pelodiscus sinensis TaxID=13735 RepID=PVAT_PELSI|nr:RecName: Full=Pelovaterin [Pelodiscus sinensis]2JR3_A Chain A, Pelovaterin [unidentified]